METRTVKALKTIFCLIILSAPLYAEGPEFRHKDATIHKEFLNVYKDIRRTFSIANSSSLPSGSTNYIANIGADGSNQEFTVVAGTVSVLSINGAISMYSPSANRLRFVVDGVPRFFFTESGDFANESTTNSPYGAILAGSGTVSAPALSFNVAGRTGDGIYSISDDNLGIVTNGALAVQIDSIGSVLRPLQPSFLVNAPSNTANVTGDGTDFTVEFDTEIRDANSDFNTGTYIFTAPVTGHYELTFSVRLIGLTSSHDRLRGDIVTSNRTYSFYGWHPTVDVDGQQVVQGSVIADMDSGDTAYINVNVSGSTKVVEVHSITAPNYFSGTLVN